MPLARAKEAFIEALGTFGVDYTNGTHDKAVADTFPASDPTTEQQPGGEPEPSATASPRRGRRAAGAPARRGRGRRLRARPRLRRDRRDHVVHEHLEPAGDGRPPGCSRRRRVERGLERKPWVKSSLAPGSKVVTEYYEKAGLGRTSTSSASTRSATAARRASATRGRCRRDLGGGHRGRPRRLLRALRQPQLRGAHPSRGEGELPRVAAARRRVLARRPHGHRPARTSRSARATTATRLPARHLADAQEINDDDRVVGARRDVRARRTRDVFTGDETWRALDGAGGRAVRLGARVDVRAPAAVLRGDVARARHRSPDIDGARVPRRARRLGDDRPHLARRRDPARTRRPASISSSTASSARTSTRTARGAATTR